jgi:hypothetical protein
MAKQFSIYKGLQKPLIYKGFQGKFIGWGIASLVLSLVLGGVIGCLTKMFFGGLICVGGFVGGLMFTSQQQKKGLHFKTRHIGVFQFGNDFKKLRNGNTQKKNRV